MIQRHLSARARRASPWWHRFMISFMVPRTLSKLNAHVDGCDSWHNWKWETVPREVAQIHNAKPDKDLICKQCCWMGTVEYFPDGRQVSVLLLKSRKVEMIIPSPLMEKHVLNKFTKRWFCYQHRGHWWELQFYFIHKNPGVPCAGEQQQAHVATYCAFRAGAQIQPWVTQRVLFSARRRNFAGPTNISHPI